MKSLRSKEIQEILDAAIFEPGQWQQDIIKECPDVVPSPDRDYLSTSVGLLFNEIRTAPHILLEAVQHMLEKVIEMDTGKFSQVSESILYVTRLAVRIEGYLMFLNRNFQFHTEQGNSEKGHLNGAYQEASVRGLDCPVTILNDALKAQKSLRELLDGRVFKLLARWIKISKKEGKMLQVRTLT